MPPHEVEIVGCETWDDAVSRLEEKEADLLVICYAFDEMRPFRLLQYLRQERPRAHLPTILVRALPVPLGKTQEEQIRESYQNLGVDQFYNLYDEKQREGDEVALRHFREAVLARLPQGGGTVPTRGKTIRVRSALRQEVWRRERDSNPRYRFKPV